MFIQSTLQTDTGFLDQTNSDKYPDLLKNAPIGIFTITSDGRFVSANQTLSRMLGYETPSILIDAIADIGLQIYADPEDRKQVKYLLDTHGEAIDYECRWRRSNGKAFWVSIHAKAVRDRKGSAVYYQGFASNITQRKRAEETLREKMHLLQNISDNMFDLVSLADMNGNYMFLSASYAVLGYDLDYLVGRHALEFLHPDDLPDITVLFQTSIERREGNKKAEYRIRHADGKYLWFETVGRFICGANGEPKQILFSSRDITERKRAEEALRENQKNLIEAQRIAKIGHFCWDAQTGEVRCSDALYELLKYDKAETIACPQINGKINHPDDHERIMRWLIDSIKSDTSELSPNEYRVIRKDGEIIFVRADGIIQHRPGKKPIIFATIQDVSERKQAEEERERLQAQLIHAQKLESIGRLAGGVAHDYNNMLGVILGYAEIVMDKTVSDNSVQEDLKEIVRAARRSADVTRKLLAFARKQAIRPQALDLNATVEDMLKMIRQLIGEEIDLSWQAGSGLWLVEMDPAQVDQVLVNLCINARDAITGMGRISIGTQNVFIDDAFCSNHAEFQSGEYVMLYVSDDGHGMDKELCENIFEPFFTTKGVGEGTGLGIPTVYGIVKQNKGFVQVYSEPGKGTTFKLYVPSLTGQSRENEVETIADIPRGRGETVLVVEDEISILKLTEKMLKSLCYTVLKANTPAAAIELASKHAGRIQLLITDVVMPEMSGRDLAGELQANCPGLKVLFMSGYTADIITRSGVLDENVDFIQKPFSLKLLAAKVNLILHPTCH